MNRIVRENYPVADLPEDLREGFELDASVTVTVEVITKTVAAPSLDDLIRLLSPPWLTREEIIAQIDELREDRDL